MIPINSESFIDSSQSIKPQITQINTDCELFSNSGFIGDKPHQRKSVLIFGQEEGE